MVGQLLNSPSFGYMKVDSCEKDLVIDVYLLWIISKLVSLCMDHIKNTRLVSKCSIFFGDKLCLASPRWIFVSVYHKNIIYASVK